MLVCLLDHKCDGPRKVNSGSFIARSFLAETNFPQARFVVGQTKIYNICSALGKAVPKLVLLLTLLNSLQWNGKPKMTNANYCGFLVFKNASLNVNITIIYGLKKCLIMFGFGSEVIKIKCIAVGIAKLKFILNKFNCSICK